MFFCFVGESLQSVGPFQRGTSIWEEVCIHLSFNLKNKEPHTRGLLLIVFEI